ncbi:MAG: nitroreductase family protein [Chloroflexi bacterium]|nr:nitroreductase family protein [Chloroflexota bacterium]
MDASERFPISLGEAIFSLRAIRRVRPDPIPEADLRDILTAAIQAPNGGNAQPWHFLVVRDPRLRRQLGELYREAWWAKRADQGIHGPEDIDRSNRTMVSAMRLADEFGEAPVVVLVCATEQGANAMGSVIPSVQNLLLAARALGIGGTITTLHAVVDERAKELLGIPGEAQIVYAVPLGYPRGAFGPVTRKPLAEVASVDRWGDSIG